MDNKITITKFDGSTAPGEKVDKYADFRIKLFKHIQPDDQAPTKESIKKEIRIKRKDQNRYTRLAWDNNIVIGQVRLVWENETSPEFEANRNIVWGDLSVLPEYRKKGIGSQLAKILTSKFLETDRQTFQIGTDDPDGFAYVDHIGIGKLGIEGTFSRVYFDQVDWDLMTQWVEEGSQRALDVTINTFQNVPEEIIQDYTSMFTKCLNLVPKEDLEWEAVITPKARREDEERTRNMGYTWISMISMESNGAISGMTETFFNPENNHIAYQGLTAVLPEYRGRGLGKWLKAKMAIYVRDKWPTVKYIETDNADVNDPMLSINRRMGFKVTKKDKVYKFTRDDLNQLSKKLS